MTGETMRQHETSIGPHLRAASVAATLVLLAACSPTIKVEAPDKPIEINLNVKIDQEVRIVVDQKLEQAVQQNPDIF
jgi:hypothetical protein